MLFTIKFWLVFAMGFFGTSQGMLFLSVLLGSLHISHGGVLGGQSVAVVMGTLCSAIGRLSIGVLSDATLVWFKRIYWAFPMYGMMLVGMLMCMVVSSPEIIVAASCLIGLGYGGLAGGILPTLTADLFGTQHFAKNYSILQPAYPIGFLVWGQACGALYDLQVPRGESVCIGQNCHFSVLILQMCLVAVSVGTNPPPLFIEFIYLFISLQGAATWLSFILPGVKRVRKLPTSMIELNDPSSAPIPSKRLEVLKVDDLRQSREQI